VKTPGNTCSRVSRPLCAVLAGSALLSLTVAGCGKQGSSLEGKQSYAPSAATAPTEMAVKARAYDESSSDTLVAEPTPAPANMPRKIIYTANVNLITEKLPEAARALAERVKAHGGYIAETSVSGAAGTQRTATWKIRIPVAKFDGFLAAVGTLGELQDSNTSSQDVSEEFYDVAARLKNKKTEEARLIQHLQHSTAKLTDILAVEREISRVREEIERMEGRLRFLSHQTDLSTVTVTMREIHDYVPPAPPTFGTEIARTFSGSVQAVQNTIKGLFLMLVALIPWTMPIGGAVAGILYLRRRQKRLAEAKAAAARLRNRSDNDE
jgi:hypothetical protein